MGVELTGSTYGTKSYGTENYKTESASNTSSVKVAESASKTEAAEAAKTAAVVYEKGTEGTADSTRQIYTKEDRAAIIKQLKDDAAARQEKLVQLVADTLNGQKLKSDISKLFGSSDRNGIGLKSIFEAMNVDQATIDQAKADIAEDGYWGVEKTSDRLVDMAKALSGNNPEKADLLMDAVKKGFKEATKAWGDDLPDISQKTLDATMEKMQAWKDSVNSTAATAAVPAVGEAGK